MKEVKLKDLKQSYEGKAVIIPCADFDKYERDAFDDTRNDIIDACWEKRIICNWDFREDAFDSFDDIDDEEVKDEFWYEIVCHCFRSGFLVIYTQPVPSNIKKENGRIVSWTHNGFGYTQTRYIHLEDISQLTSVLHNIDRDLLETVWKEENRDSKDE